MIFSGFRILNLLEEADKQLWKFDIRRVKRRNLILELLKFCKNAETFDAKHNKNRNKFLFNLFHKNVENLNEILEENWNNVLKVK